MIADGDIDFPEVMNADILIILSQEAYDKYAGTVKEGGLTIIDTSTVLDIASNTAVKLPITEIAKETTGRPITANTVALGVLVQLTNVVSTEAIAKAVAARAPKGTQEINQAALEAGFKAAEEVSIGSE